MKTLFFLIFCLFTQVTAWQHDFSIGGHHNYTDVNFKSGYDVEGYLTGVDVSYTLSEQCLFGELLYEGSWTLVDAVGSPCETSCLSEQLAAVRLGFMLDLSCIYTFQTYVGVGYDNYKHKQLPDGSPLTWDFQKIYIPVGFYVRGPLSRQLAMGIRFEWRPDVYSKVNLSSASDIDSCLELSNGFRLEIPFIFYLDPCNCWSIQCVPFADWNRWGRAKEKDSFGIRLPIEPQKRLNIGYKWSLGLKF